MSFRRFTLRVVATLGVCMAWSTHALAAGVAILTPVTRKINLHNGQADQMVGYWISREDCLEDDVLHFNVSVTDGGSNQLEVWANIGGADCSVRESRMSPFRCLQLSSSPASTATQQVDIRAQDIALLLDSGSISALNGLGQGKGTIAACDNTPGGVAAQDVSLQFMLIRSGNLEGMPTTWSQTKIDLLGPPAAAGLTAQGASTFLKLDWQPPTDQSDIAGYQFLCDPPPGAAADAAVADVVSSTPSQTCDASTPTTDAAADAGDAGSDATCIAQDAATSAGNCGGFNFVPNAAPSVDLIARYGCGTGAQHDSSAKAEGFATNTHVAVAIAAFDAVKNYGPLSNVSCTETKPVDGFIDLYHQAGGTAGGGFCSMASSPGERRNGLLDFSVVFLAVYAFRRRSRAASN